MFVLGVIPPRWLAEELPVGGVALGREVVKLSVCFRCRIGADLAGGLFQFFSFQIARSLNVSLPYRGKLAF